jgi:hypothetical protein
MGSALVGQVDETRPEFIAKTESKRPSRLTPNPIAIADRYSARMAIALSPAGARSIIASGRMAVFIGCESAFDHEGDTRPRRGPAFPR